ncbi:2-phosphosulfolactate phosphatase [Deinococcus wulumuqiensis]
MKLRVDLLPDSHYPNVALVIDVLRATTTAVALLERGAGGLLLTRTAEDALGVRAARPEVLLAGERGGLTIPGFDLGNSPVEVGEAAVAGRQVVMTTTNGTGAAWRAAQSARHVVLAALINAHAVARHALAVASEEIAIVCAGTDGRVGLDDVYAAGVIAEYLLALGDFQVDDGARIALTMRRGGGDPGEALRGSGHGATLEKLGLGADVDFAAQLSTSRLIPTLVPGDDVPGGALRFLAG